MFVFFAITTTVIFQVGLILFCFKVKQIQASNQQIQFA
jgi:hypothetical protein